MGDAYTPGLAVTRSTVVRKVRRLPLAGTVVVEHGARVKAGDVVARTELPGKVSLLNLATALGVMADEVQPTLAVPAGDAIARGAVIARRPTWFGLSTREVRSPIGGTLESVSPVTGMAILREPPVPVELHAYVDGTIVDIMPNEGVVVEARAALVQGIFGLGGERQAKIAVVATDRTKPLEPGELSAKHRDRVVIAGGRVTLETFRRAMELGVAAIVCGGFAYQDVRELLGYDVGVAVTGTEAIGTTLIVTEGFGDIAMAKTTFDLLDSLDGKLASVNGATQIRAGVIRPEVIVTDDVTATRDSGAGPAAGLAVGATVRCIRAPYFGKIGRVAALPVELHVLPSETKVRVVEVELGKERVTIPRANVEVIER
jgi:hypothetical protein